MQMLAKGKMCLITLVGSFRAAFISPRAPIFTFLKISELSWCCFTMLCYFHKISANLTGMYIFDSHDRGNWLLSLFSQSTPTSLVFTVDVFHSYRCASSLLWSTNVKRLRTRLRTWFQGRACFTNDGRVQRRIPKSPDRTCCSTILLSDCQGLLNSNLLFTLNSLRELQFSHLSSGETTAQNMNFLQPDDFSSVVIIK